MLGLMQSIIAKPKFQRAGTIIEPREFWRKGALRGRGLIRKKAYVPRKIREREIRGSHLPIECECVSQNVRVIFKYMIVYIFLHNQYRLMFF